MSSFFRKHREPDQDEEMPSGMKVKSPPRSPNSTMSFPSIIEAGTMDTVETEASRQASNDHHCLTIEHTMKGSKKSSTARKISKPIIAIIGTLILMVTGSTAYYFSIVPGLKTQVDRLEEQNAVLKAQVDKLESQVTRLGGEVDRLSTEVDRLSNETDRLEAQNLILEQNVEDYSNQNDRLNSTLAVYGQLNIQLNETTINLGSEVNNLTTQNDRLSILVERVNATVTELTQQVDELERVRDSLTAANDELWQTVEYLSNETADLSMVNEQLNNTVQDIEEQVTSLSEEIQRLSNLTSNLQTVVSFFNETAQDINESFDAFAEQLADQITKYRGLVMNSLENLYRQRAASWDCDFREYFLMDSFTSNRNAPIGPPSYPKVIDYVEERILSDLCLSTIDFEYFLQAEYLNSTNLSDASFNQLQRAVGRYTDLAVEYYFSGSGSDPAQWAEANYNCNNLPLDARYQYKVEVLMS